MAVTVAGHNPFFLQSSQMSAFVINGVRVCKRRRMVDLVTRFSITTYRFIYTILNDVNTLWKENKQPKTSNTINTKLMNIFAISVGEDFVIIACVVLTHGVPACDRQTDRRTDGQLDRS